MSRDHLIGVAFIFVGVLLLALSVLNLMDGDEAFSGFRVHISIEFGDRSG